MVKSRALKHAIEITKVALDSAQLTYIPGESAAKELADFIETLTGRLEKMGELD